MYCYPSVLVNMLMESSLAHVLFSLYTTFHPQNDKAITADSFRMSCNFAVNPFVVLEMVEHEKVADTASAFGPWDGVNSSSSR